MTKEKIRTQHEDALIPEIPSLAGWKEVPIRETEKSQEPLVAIGLFSDYGTILSSSVYADEHYNSPYAGGLSGSEVAVFMRQGVVDRLVHASKLLSPGMYLMVMDAYRSLEVQTSLYEQYTNGLRQKYPDWSEDQIANETQKYVSIPSTDLSRPSPHNTGASVDVVIVAVDDETQRAIDDINMQYDALEKDDWQNAYVLEIKKNQLLRRHAKMLDFGTRFDHGGQEAALRHYEVMAQERTLTEPEQEILRNRRLLYAVMIQAGFEPYADEWWHYNDPASQMGAKVARRDYAEYGAIELSLENIEFAQIRALHHENTARMAQGETWIPPRGLETHYGLAQVAARASHPRTMRHMSETVAKIEPPKADTTG